MKSILSNEKRCFLCSSRENLEKHHCIFGTAGRNKAEKDGLWVYLCHDCHFGIHNFNNFAKKSLQERAQEKWEETYGDRDAFIERYGRSYL